MPWRSFSGSSGSADAAFSRDKGADFAYRRRTGLGPERLEPPMSPAARLAFALMALLSLGGCSFEAFTYTVDRYGAVRSKHVHLGCRDTYEVFDRPSAASLLVTTNALNESLASLCGTGPELLPKEARTRRVAQIFLDESADRRDCRITRATALGEFHAEYGYRCGTAPPNETIRPRLPGELEIQRSTTSKRRG